jgi:hypothetical protein
MLGNLSGKAIKGTPEMEQSLKCSSDIFKAQPDFFLTVIRLAEQKQTSVI